MLTFKTVFRSFFFFFGIIICFKITIGGSFCPDAVQLSTQVKCTLSWPVVYSVMDDSPLVNSPSERQVKRQRYFNHIYDSQLSLSEWICGSNFILIVGRELLTQSHLFHDGSQKSETPRWSTCEIFNLLFSGDCFGFQLDLHGGNTSALCSLCAQPVFKNVFKFGPSTFMTSESFYRLFALGQFFTLPHPMSNVHCQAYVLYFFPQQPDWLPLT